MYFVLDWKEIGELNRSIGHAVLNYVNLASWNVPKSTVCTDLRWTINNYWMRLSMISRIIQIEVNVISQSRRLRRITVTEVWMILDIMRKWNPVVALLYIQNGDRCKKRFAVIWTCYFVIFGAFRWLRHQRPIIFFFFLRIPSNNSRYSTEMMSRLLDIEN